MIYNERPSLPEDFPPPPPEDSPRFGMPGFKTVMRLIKLVLMVIALILKLANSPGCAHNPESRFVPTPEPMPGPDEVVVANVVTQAAVEEAFGQRFIRSMDAQYFVEFSSVDGSFFLMTFLATETAGRYEEENRKSGDSIQPVDGLGDAAEFILNEKGQELIVQHGQYLIVLNCMASSGAPSVDHKAELLALGKLCLINLNKLLDR